jgi:diaminohydroxyphosphoribosylaminopyrimidine deaminase/5-amino-6-(5-phosphoribosylamino)uracil reductase
MSIPSIAGDEVFMARAVELASTVRHSTSPNPWVGAIIVASSGAEFEGATHPPGGPHAEQVALAAADASAEGATLYTTLEPCAHHGRTGPCTDAVIRAGVARVVVAMEDPDPLVAGSGLGRLRDAGITVEVGCGAEAVREQLAPYIHHRMTGRPWVVVKSAMSLDGRTAAPDGTSQWITSAPARADGHRIRAESDAIVVGAATVRSDDPALTVRDWAPASDHGAVDPLRVVLGDDFPDEARVHPCLIWTGALPALLDDLGERGVVQLMVEGGASVVAAFGQAELVDRYVIYVAPAFFGGDDGVPLFGGPGVPTVAELARGHFVGVERIGPDVRVELEVERSSPIAAPDTG